MLSDVSESVRARLGSSRLRSVQARVRDYVARLKAMLQRAFDRLPPHLRAVLRNIYHDIAKHDLSGLAAELSYHLFLALFPFLILLATLASFAAQAAGVSNPANHIIDLFGNAISPDTTKVIKGQIDKIVNASSGGLLSFGILGTLWAAASAIGAIIKATNRVYAVQELRPFWKRSLIMVGLTLSAGVGLLLAFIVLLGAQVYGAKIADSIGAGSAFEITVSIVRFPIAIALVLIAIAILYWAAPNTPQSFRWVSPGAVFFTVTWLVATSLFGLYVSHFSSYNATYGALAGVVVLLVWLHLTSFLLLLGAEINAAVEREAEIAGKAPQE